MFEFLLTENAKARAHARRWLEMAQRVWDYRRDQLPAAQLQRLEAAREELRRSVKQKTDAPAIKTGIEKLDAAMRECGGRVYPTTSMVENVEFFLVAAIVILGLRAYFVQPFKIPTNSMWPSYYGMTAQTFPAGQEPGALAKAGRLALLGARNYRVTAPADGEVLMAVFPDLNPAYAERSGRSMLVFPTTLHRYAFSVGGQEATLEVPADFQSEMSRVFDETFRGSAASMRVALRESAQRVGMALETSTWRVRAGANPVDVRVAWVPTGRMVRKGETILSFDILTGDLLFVERISYNFVRPKVGSGFVFKTGHIPKLAEQQGDRYFVKRLVGLPGDTLEVRPPALYRNGQPIDGSTAFAANAGKTGLYPGYINTGLLGAGETFSVPEHAYFAMGDNSPNSFDSRGWGPVPEKDVVGRPLFIYDPITKRWGPAH